MKFPDRRLRLRILFFVWIGACCSIGTFVQARDLTFEERVAAQTAIERVYYEHQIGTKRRFDQVMTRDLLEAKVHMYLKQSLALEKIWHTPVTTEMLDKELERMVAHSRMPDRLRELYRALGDDPFLIRECLARPAIVDRLTRNLFARDGTIHHDTRSNAEAFRERLLVRHSDRLTGGRRPGASARQEDPVQARVRSAGGVRVVLEPDVFENWDSRSPAEIGAVGPLQEERDRFFIDVTPSRSSTTPPVTGFDFPKRTWDDWWTDAGPILDDSSVSAIAREDGTLPELASETICDNDTWNNGSLDDVPSPRVRHTAVWTGTYMVVWGGTLEGPLLNSGGRYDPATDTWSPTATTDAPSARAFHSAAWTGSEMIVWGGYSLGIVPVNTGARYDPMSDHWTPLSTLNAPSGRQVHTAVWTGSEMLVWGGYSGAANLNTGGRYNPASDSWAPLTTLNAPSARELHTAVWTGNEMVVWGGASGLGLFLNTGGIYDPTADAWTPTSIINAPSPRYLHAAVWSGSGMIVWGGGTDSGRLNTGGRYDPRSDSWTVLSTVGAPSARYGPTAVWTGTRMVVWGGSDSNSLDTGGVYDEAVDSWSPTTTVNAPAAHSSHTAVWTGTEMIVWGGYGLSAEVNTGGRYNGREAI